MFTNSHTDTQTKSNVLIYTQSLTQTPPYIHTEILSHTQRDTASHRHTHIVIPTDTFTCTHTHTHTHAKNSASLTKGTK